MGMVRVFQRVLSLIIGLAFIGWIGFGASMSYIAHDPEAAAAVAVGAASVDMNGDLLDQPGNFASGASAGSAMMREAQRMKEREKLARARDSYGDDWGDSAVAGDWGN